MTGLETAAVGLCSAAILSFWAWVGVSLIRLSRDYVELAARVRARENHCAEQLLRYGEVETKMNEIAVDVSYIKATIDGFLRQQGGKP